MNLDTLSPARCYRFYNGLAETCICVLFKGVSSPNTLRGNSIELFELRFELPSLTTTSSLTTWKSVLKCMPLRSSSEPCAFLRWPVVTPVTVWRWKDCWWAELNCGL